MFFTNWVAELAWRSVSLSSWVRRRSVDRDVRVGSGAWWTLWRSLCYKFTAESASEKKIKNWSTLGEVVSKTRSLVNDNYNGVTEIIMIIIHATYDGVVFSITAGQVGQRVLKDACVMTLIRLHKFRLWVDTKFVEIQL